MRLNGVKLMSFREKCISKYQNCQNYKRIKGYIFLVTRK